MIGLDRRTFLSGVAGTTALVRAPRALAESGALAADLDLLQRIYETLHPGLYRYQTPSEFRQRCRDARTLLGKPVSLQAQYLILSRLLAQLRCGHTYANFFNQTKAVADSLFAPANKLPFHFTWLGSRLVVIGNPLNVDGVTTGDEILSIDKAPASHIQSTLLPYIRADGSNDDKRRKLLCVTGNDRIETFDVFHALLFPSARQTFRLSVRSSGTGRVRTVDVTAIDQKTRESMRPKTSNLDTSDYWTLRWAAARTAVITMPGWAMYDVKWDWRARIQSMFDEIAAKGATGLIIDLRDNEGGNDCGNEIISHLIDSDLPLSVDADRLVRFRSTPADLNQYLDTWDRSFEHLGEGADDVGNGFFRLKSEEDEVRRISPKGPRFRGKVIVLSSAQNSSATFQFISLVRKAGLATVYGQPTGGNQRGINGSCFFFVKLPNSGLEADLPLIGVFPRTAKPDAGLTPDVRVDPRVEDVATGYDRVLQSAVAVLA